MKGRALRDLLTQNDGATPHELPQELRELVRRLEETMSSSSQKPTASELPLPPPQERELLNDPPTVRHCP
jgi:hypothetical protein